MTLTVESENTTSGTGTNQAFQLKNNIDAEFFCPDRILVIANLRTDFR